MTPLFTGVGQETHVTVVASMEPRWFMKRISLRKPFIHYVDRTTEDLRNNSLYRSISGKRRVYLIAATNRSYAVVSTTTSVGLNFLDLIKT